MSAPTLTGGFEGRSVATPGGDLFLQVGGAGPAVLLIHGNCQTGDMWGPLAARLAEERTVVVPDLAGIGRSAPRETGYEKRLQAEDLETALDSLGLECDVAVGHDLGGMVAYAYAARNRERVRRLVVMEAPLPGVDPWPEVVMHPDLWHFNARGPHLERLVAGRERIWFDRFWDFAANPERISAELRDHYAAQYALPGSIHASFSQFAAFAADAEDIAELARSPLEMRVLAVGGEFGFGPVVAATMRNVAANVEEWIVPATGHWLIEETEDDVVERVVGFLDNDGGAAQ